ncbi:MAG TPA: ABC transporter substrate-binding protein [Jatrophihabitans sp.]|jgi:ABC-type branched-subunit amino acid transport system substrate-binding protein|uniref:ABC transporter substrate-binding protein n=1 Tax=Jatrophihabitans sp. TaxID=1932789 RepID=UPI002EF02F68
MTRITTHALPAAVLTLALGLAVSGCSTKANDAAGAKTENGTKVGPGVTADKITLGVLTDQSGVFAALGTTVTQGNQLAVDDINAAGGICGRKIVLQIKDTAYDVQKAVSQYAEISPNIAGILQVIGSPTTTALLPSIKTDNMLTATSTWASSLLSSPNIQISGATYDIEMINGISYLLDEGLVRKGDKLGHIAFEGAYGDNGLEGTKYAVDKLGLTVVPQRVKATETDMTSAVQALKQAGVRAILLTAAPKQLASAAGVAASIGLDVPILGNNPTYTPALLSTSVGRVLEKNFYLSASSLPLSADHPVAKKVLASYKAKYPKGSPNAGVTYGYGVGKIYEHTLKAACAAKDLSREGITAAFHTLSDVDTEGVISPLDYSKPGEIPSRQTYILRPSMANLAVDGLKVGKELFESPVAKDYSPSAG